MTMLLWTVFIVSEIGLAIYEIAENATKKEWTLKRLIVSGGQILIYLLMLALPGIDLSFRFTGLIFMLAIRALIAGGVWLINRSNEDKKKNLWMILSAVLGVVLISMSMIPAFVFKDYKGRPVSGPYEVADSSAILIDKTRLETNENDGSYREVPVYFYYPSALKDIKEHSLPLVIFSHGAFGYYESNTSTYMELASNGYVVVSIEHPYHSLFTKDTTGKTIIVDPEFFTTALEAGNRGEAETYRITSKWMEIREADMNFALDTIIKASKASEYDDAWFYTDDKKEEISNILKCVDTERIGLMGHSLGGATAVSVGRREDVSAVIDFDGTMLGENTGIEDGKILVNEDPYDTPLLCFDNESHHADGVIAREEGLTYSNNVILDNAKDGYSTYFEGSAHMNYTDLPLFSPFLAKNLGMGSVDPEYCIDKVNEITLRFYDHYLKGIGDFEVDEKY